MTTHSPVNARPAVIAAVTALGLTIAGCGSGSVGLTDADSAQRPATSAASGTATATSTTRTPSSPSSTPRTAASDVADSTHPLSAGLVPLWPFTTAAQVRQWQAAYRSGGSQPWHLDAAQTALAFTRGHLGYTEIDRVTSRRINGGNAHVGVGWHIPEVSRTRTVAVLHLIRVGAGPDRPWVVVGSDDTLLTLDIPRYGSTVTSPLRVGGRITGVDESLRVLVLGPASSRPLFASAGVPAGGQRTPWSTTVRFRAPRGTVLTIAVSTGGHVKQVEAFAVTAVRAS